MKKHSHEMIRNAKLLKIDNSNFRKMAFAELTEFSVKKFRNTQKFMHH